MIVEAAEKAGLTRAWIAANDTFQCRISDECLARIRARDDKWLLSYKLPVKQRDVGRARCIVTHQCFLEVLISDACELLVYFFAFYLNKIP